MNFSTRRLIDNQDTIYELAVRILEVQNEVNCMSDSFPVNQRYSHLFEIMAEC